MNCDISVKPQDVLKAYRFLKGKVLETPLERSEALSLLSGGDIFLKLENLQVCRSFKIRGALNVMFNLPEEMKRKGVVTCSSGNHAQGVAIASRELRVKSVIVVPKDCPVTKKEAIRMFGGDWIELVEHGCGYDAAFEEAERISKESKLLFIPPGEHKLVMAGAGTVGYEIVKENPDIDAILVPAGSGGLMLGMATIVKAINPDIKIYGIQSEASPPWYYSWKEGKLVDVEYKPSLSEGTWGSIKECMFEFSKDKVDGFILVSEEEIKEAIAFAAKKLHLLVEGAGSLGIAAILSGRFNAKGRRVALVISGGNIDGDVLKEVL
ncbi:MAG: threonine/serine dehydratase [Synergistetes bacterium]|nr:threonine/serine dehydratase [Synergistota bacterium]MDW8192321.1 threonine/serine dehydratase [Synergistota bacterium]